MGRDGGGIARRRVGVVVVGVVVVGKVSKRDGFHVARPRPGGRRWSAVTTGVREGDHGETGAEDGGDGMGDEDGGRAEARRRDASRRGGERDGGSSARGSFNPSQRRW